VHQEEKPIRLEPDRFSGIYSMPDE